jgi:sialate O-acetylesterase
LKGSFMHSEFSALMLTAGLTDDSVLQRDANDVATVAARGIAPAGVAGPILATVARREAPLPGWEARPTGQAENGVWTATLEGLPTGGPYTMELFVEGHPESAVRVRGVLVGDLWVLAGQSNMEGYGILEDVETPSPFVHVFDMADRWHLAEEPLHWLCDSPDRCHNEVTGEEQRRLATEARQTRAVGAGLGLTFAKTLHAATGVPIGLIPCAHGGTSLTQWSPARKHEGGDLLYGSMLRRVRAVGGRVRGLLWYQGESDANTEDAARYASRFREFVQNVREDFGDAELPVAWVQIGRLVTPLPWPNGGPDAWNAIQEIQRRLAGEIPHTAVVPAVDLELDDAIHIGRYGLKRLGRRLAEAIQYSDDGFIRLRAVTVEGPNRNCIRVAFDGVSAGGFPRSHRVTGFTLHNGQGEAVALIYKAQIDPQRPSDALLWLLEPPSPGMTLRYGAGYDPPATLADTDDKAAPVFGPILLG